MSAFKLRRWVAVATLSSLIPALAVAAVGDHVWSTGFSAGGELGLDGSNYFVTHGTFFGTINLGGSDMSSVNFLDGDQYLARYDAQGNHIWSQQFTPDGSGASNEHVAVDPAGNSYLTGYVWQNTSIDFGGGDITGPLMYVAKLDANGTHQWSMGFDEARPTAIVADGSHVVITGYTTTGVDFGGGTVGAAGDNDVFVVQLTAAGAHSWSAGFGDASGQGGMAVTLDSSGNVVLVGSAFGTIDLGGGSVAANGLDLFVAKYNSSGAHQWSHVFDGTFTPGGGILVSASVATGPSDEILLSGEMLNTVDFGGGDLTSYGFGDAYLAKFDASGSHQWSVNYGSADGTDYEGGVSVDGAGNVLASFRASGDADFGGGSLMHTGQSYDRNLIVAVYDAAGAHEYSKNFGICGTSKASFGSSGQLMVSGYSSSGIDMGGGSISPATLFVAELEGLAGPPIAVDGRATSAPMRIELFPNPFNPRSTVEYTLARDGMTKVLVHDARGRLVKELVPARYHAAGSYSVPFNARASGVYYVSVVGDGIRQSVKAIAVK